MGVKSAKSRQAKRELKKNLKSGERCPYCHVHVKDVQQHIRKEHGFSCSRCGQPFASERQWKQHMRDKHGLNDQAAVRDDRKAKLEKWLHNSANTASAAAAKEEEEEDCMEESPQDGLRQHTCELCGKEVALPVDLCAQGLSFQCAFAGQSCLSGGRSGGAMQAAAAAGQSSSVVFCQTWRAPASISTAPASISTTPAAFSTALSQVGLNAAINTAIPSDGDDDL